MNLPSPDNYATWQEYARALLTALEAANVDPAQPARTTSSSPSGPLAPPGYSALWVDNATAEMFLANPAFSPPTAPDLFQIDTLQLADVAVEVAKIADGAVGFYKLADGAVQEAKLGDLAVSSAKLQNLAAISAKIGDLAVLTAKIGDLQVLTAKIADLQVNDAKIANLAVTSAKIANLAVLSANIGLAQITQALIANAAIGSAQIGSAAVLTANIGVAQIITALIADAAVTNAKIGDAEITSAKIVSLVVDKIAGGSLGVNIDLGTGMITASVGGSSLYLGKGFGSTGQFFLWFGPTMSPASCTEANGTIWFKTNGDAYFGGSLSSGVLKNEGTSSDLSTAAAIVVGPFGSNGGAINVNCSYYFEHYYECNAGTGAISGSGGTTLTLEQYSGGTWNYLTTLAANETIRNVVVDGSPGVRDQVTWAMAGATTFSWTPGVVPDAQLRLRISAARTEPSLLGTTIVNTLLTQRVGIVAVEA